MNVREFITESLKELTDQMKMHDNTWGIGSVDHWNADVGVGLLGLGFADGTTAFAPVQIVGVYKQKEGTFLWGWGNPVVPAVTAEHARKVLEFGRKYNIEEFLLPEVVCSQTEAWEYTAVAAKLAGANGGYCGKAGEMLIYMTFGEISLQKEPS